MKKMQKTHTLLPVFSAGITGTSFMTFFSYLISKLQSENFREPEILARLIYRIIPQINKRFSHIAGWNLHYSVGFLFAICYATFWEGKHKPGMKSGLLFGGLSGILAVFVWKSTLSIHPSPPKIKFHRFYGHIFLAHLIFGCFASIGYRLMRSRQRAHHVVELNKQVSYVL